MNRYKAEIQTIGGNDFIVGMNADDKIVAVSVSEIEYIVCDIIAKSVIHLKSGHSVVYPFPTCDLLKRGWDPFEKPSLTASEVCLMAGGISMAVLNCLMSRMGFPKYQEVGDKRLWVKSAVSEWIDDKR